MNSAQALQQVAATSDMVLKSYVSDLSDADLLLRPHPGCNHLAWQLGHLISSECGLVNGLKPGAAPELPAGFAERHGKDQAADNNPAHFESREAYLALYDTVRAATSAALATLADADLDAPNPNEGMRAMFPTAGSMWALVATHPLMHAGQFVPVRRELSKPVLI